MKNPLIESDDIAVVPNYGKNYQQVNKATGEMIDVKQFETNKTGWDNEPFVKTFMPLLMYMSTLTESEFRLIFWIMSSMVKDSDIVFISVAEVQKECDFKSRSTVYNAIEGLEEIRFIAKSGDPGHWFINPNMFYKGNRDVSTIQPVRDRGL